MKTEADSMSIREQAAFTATHVRQMSEMQPVNVREQAVDLGMSLACLAAALGYGSEEENYAGVLKTVDMQSWESIQAVAESMVSMLNMYKGMCNEMRAQTTSIRERLGVVEHTGAGGVAAQQKPGRA